MTCRECRKFESLGKNWMGEEGGRCTFDDLIVPALGRCSRFERKEKKS